MIPERPSTAISFSRLENDFGPSTTNDAMTGVGDLGSSSTGVGCLTMVDETSSTSDDISPRD